MKILESRELSKGIFWVKNPEDINNSGIFLDIPCNADGTPQDSSYLNAKTGTTYNHERTWQLLDNKITDGKPFNYYPRGRVEIANGKATIFANPNIVGEELVNWCTEKFHLTSLNGIRKIRVIADGSSHYKCYLDKER